MTKREFFEVAPKTRKDFVKKYHEDYIFRNYANMYGIAVIGDNVMLPNGKVANARVR